MKKIFIIFLFFALFPLPTKGAEKINLSVPFIPQLIDGRWGEPWSNACEEASAVMVDLFYAGKKTITKKEAKSLLLPLFKKETDLYGSNKDTDSVRTANIINKYLFYTATIKKNPTLEEIKNELILGRPVITLHYGIGLNNPLLHFRAGGSGYHMAVLSGFDDNQGEFLVNDPGFSSGLDFRYKYDTILNTLSDFNHETQKTDGVPTAIFTSPKILAKNKQAGRIYYIENEIRHYVTHPDVFKDKMWDWGRVQEMEEEKLFSFAEGESLSPQKIIDSIAQKNKEKILVRPEGKYSVYYIKDNIKHYICHPDLFKKYGWKWNEVKTVSRDWIDNIPNGQAIWE